MQTSCEDRRREADNKMQADPSREDARASHLSRTSCTLDRETRAKILQKARARPKLIKTIFLLVGFNCIFMSTVVVVVVKCLRISSIDVPAAALNGSSVWLGCNYELTDEDQLYSVKWYKNYVEFYRYQPASAAALAQVSDARLEFELEGVQLDLTKSNATHVLLRQVTSASEATYKCEISADAPSFATVSAERQLKVYILPKRKLNIINNNGPSTAMQATDSVPTLQQYSVNDMINMTCIMSPSKPTATLRWLVNDVTVEPESTWLSTRHLTPTGAPPEMKEMHLTLAFRVQTGHLQRSTGRDSSRSPASQSARHRSTAGNWLVQLKCIAQLEVEFSSETSIMLADGKTVAKRNRKPELANLPQPSSLQLNPLDALYRQFSGNPTGQRANSKKPADSAYKWPPVRQVGSIGLDSTWADSSDRQTTGGGGNQRAGASISGPGNQLMVWTSRQVRAQAEHIEQLLLRTRSNQIEPPHVEASFRSSGKNHSTEDWLDSNTRDETGGSPIEFTGNYRSDRRGPSWGSRESSMDAESMEDDAASQEAAGAYELFELTCEPLLNSPEPDLIREIRTVWLLNDKQVNGDRVNAFDGTSFYYLNQTTGNNATEPQNRKLTNLRPNQIQRRTQNPSSAHDLSGSSRNKATSHLTVELSAALMQLKELNLKCRTIVIQPLIEFEAQAMIAVAPTGVVAFDGSPPTATTTTSPFIHANEAGVDTNQHHQVRYRPSSTNRAPSGYYQRRNLANKNNISSDNNPNTNRSTTATNKHWTSVIRLRQQPSASSASSSVYNHGHSFIYSSIVFLALVFS